MREDFEVIAKTIPLVLRILKYTDLEFIFSLGVRRAQTIVLHALVAYLVHV